ncbi:hypothetical protein ACJMK2_022345 [Sinanodonta woodiana]|uniref:N-chimaerin n=1 Tax=Sinanodonta woodiana TaxID=1069815 RepID=A0ABD3TLF3_SINWO
MPHRMSFRERPIPKPRYCNMVYPQGGDSQALPTWKTYLYQLQKEAPKPKKILSTRDVPQRPPFYGNEYHGNITREEAEQLLCEQEGSYLVRKSDRAPDAYTLAIRFDGITKNFKLYYDGLHYVGEKRFETVEQLVADGLIHFYVESRAADYIASLSNESNYAESPYLAYSVKKKRLQQGKKTNASRRIDFVDGKLIESTNEPQDLTVDLDVDLSSMVSDIEKPHVFKTTNFIGLHWCDFCANFMWGLIAQGVKCQDCGFEAHKKCSEKVPNDCMPDIKHLKSLFGADLTTVVKAHQTPVPVVVEKCVKEIEQRGLNVEGLYRVAGLHDDVEEIRMAFDKGQPGISEEDKAKVLKDGLAALPTAHSQTLKYLFAHLVRVTEKKSKNMMGAPNLAIIFAPTLMRSPESLGDPLKGLQYAALEQRAIEMMLTQYKDIFLK